jgi:4-hydroxy-tetrahydrodipicolinate reductase
MYHFDDPENGNIMSFGSFSKIAAPALRLGWIHAPKRLLKVIFESGQLDSSGGVNPVISGIMQAAINSGDESANLVKVRKILWDRADALMKALDQHLPEGVSYEKPDGGYFVLVRLPTGYKAVDLLPIAAKHKVAFLPGKSFGSRMQNYLRLSFSYYDVQDQVVGAERLGAAIREFLSQGPPSSSSSSSSSSDIKVAVHGATGRLGTLIVKQLMEEDSQGMYAGAVTRDGQVPADASVVIDVTRPEGTASLLKRLADRQNPPAVIVGTTGDLPNAEMEAYAAKAPVVVVPNFSVGIPLLTNLAKAAAKSLPSTWNIELTETHHTKKVDAPSGTAKKIAAAIESTESAALAGAAVPCHALRLGDVFGDHTVHLAGPGERIELTHKATRREVFAIGAVRVAKEYARKGPGLVWL